MAFSPWALEALLFVAVALPLAFAFALPALPFGEGFGVGFAFALPFALGALDPTSEAAVDFIVLSTRPGWKGFKQGAFLASHKH